MKASTIKCALVATIALAAGASLAQEMGAEVVSGGAAVAATAQVSASSVASSVPDDNGPIIVAEGQTNSQVIASLPKQDAQAAVVAELIRRNRESGFSDKKGTIIQIGVAQDTMSKDDIEDANIALSREQLLRQAEIDARIKIASAVRTRMNGRLRSRIPGTQEKAEFERKYAAVIADKERQKAVVIALLKELDRIQANTLMTVSDDENWLVSGKSALGRVQKKYSDPSIDAVTQAKVVTLASNFQKVVDLCDDLKGKADEMFPARENESEASSYAEMKLVGCVDIVQAESWVDGWYQVAVAMVWSPKLQERALQMLAGKMNSADNIDSSAPSVGEWLRQQDLSRMVGTRQYIDGKGTPYILGFSAVEVSKDAVRAEKDVMAAELRARQAVAFALFIEGEGSSGVKDKMRKYEGKTADLAAVVSGDLFGAMPKDFTISGLSILNGQNVKHPLTKRKMYVAVAGVDLKLAASSSKILKSWYSGAAAAVSLSNYAAGEQAGMKAAYEAIANSPDAYNAGAAAGAKAVGNAVKPKSSSQTYIVNPATKPVDRHKAQEGVVVGGAGTDDF